MPLLTTHLLQSMNYYDRDNSDFLKKASASQLKQYFDKMLSLKMHFLDKGNSNDYEKISIFQEKSWCYLLKSYNDKNFLSKCFFGPPKTVLNAIENSYREKEADFKKYLSSSDNLPPITTEEVRKLTEEARKKKQATSLITSIKNEDTLESNLNEVREKRYEQAKIYRKSEMATDMVTGLVTALFIYQVVGPIFFPGSRTK